MILLRYEFSQDLLRCSVLNSFYGACMKRGNLNRTLAVCAKISFCSLLTTLADYAKILTMMTAEQMRIATQLARQIYKLAAIAGDNEIYLGNGGDVGSLLGGIANDLEQQVKRDE
jgi:hypothetical protein